MTTTTSTTSSTTAPVTPTPTPSASSVIATAANSLLTSLGTGSGIDTASLVTSLVNAQYAAQTAALQAKADTLTSQISGVSSLKSTISSFATALDTLVKGGTLTSQPVSSNTGALTATALNGSALSGLSSTVTVTKLAAAQTAVSATAFASGATDLGTGTLTLTLGKATFASDGSMASFTGNGGDADGDGVDDKAITIPVTDGKLTSIAAAINARKAGVTASVITDADGSAYLSLKGTTGAAQAFTLAGSTSSLQQIDVGVGKASSRFTATAQDAALTVDGVPVTRTSNTISDLIPGAKLQLTGLGSTALSSTTPTDALTGAVNDFVTTYNQVVAAVKEQTDPITGVLKNDSGAKALLSSLQGLTLASLIPNAGAGTPTTLAAIGVRTNRDGTLEVDTTALSTAMANYPDTIEAMLAFSADGSSGLNAKMKALTTQATSALYGLGASALSYSAAQTKVTDQQNSMKDDEATTSTRLTAQYAAMNSRVAAYKSTQTFLTNQIAAWNKSGG